MKRLLAYVILAMMFTMALSVIALSAGQFKVTLPDGRDLLLVENGKWKVILLEKTLPNGDSALVFEDGTWQIQPKVFVPEAIASQTIWTNPKDGTKMVLIPAGKFLAGVDKISVTLPAYYMALTTVTNAQYAKFLTEQKPLQAELDKWIRLDEDCFVRKTDTGYEAYGGRKAHPVVNVSWYGATAYCDWAGLRLPTELEWEKGARGTDGHIYPWGNSWDSTLCQSHQGSGSTTTAPAEAFPNGRSPYGLYQMAGNVWEWTADWYEENAYDRYLAGDLTPPTKGNGRVARGGNMWAAGYEEVDALLGGSLLYGCAQRNDFAPAGCGEADDGLSHSNGFIYDAFTGDYSMLNLGFRCARTP